MTAKKRWTEEEDLVILSKVKASPENLSYAFTEASKELNNRAIASCSQRWYNHISKNTDKTNTCFVVVSKHKYGRNRKNCNKTVPKHARGSMWSKILKFFFN